MDKDAFGQSQMKDEPPLTLASIIHYLEEEKSCPPEVLERFTEFAVRTDVTVEDLPADLKWMVSMMLERDDALMRCNKSKISEQNTFNKLIKAQQEKEQAQTLARESVEAGAQLSDLCDRYYEDYKSLSAAHFTSGSEKASNLSEGCDEATDLTDDGKGSKSQNKTREELGDYFRDKRKELSAVPDAKNKKEGGAGKKSQKATAEATGADILAHLGEEDDLSESTYDGYEELSALVENLCKKAPKASDGLKVKYARCKPGHLDAVVADIEQREVFYDINGDVLPPTYLPPGDLEINGLQLRLVSYEAVPEIEMIPATAVLVKSLYPIYKASLKNLGTEDRDLAILRLQERFKDYDIYVDGAKKAAKIVLTPRMSESFLEEEWAADEGDGEILADLCEEDTGIDYVEEDTGIGYVQEDMAIDCVEEDLEESDENEEDMTSPISSEQEPYNAGGRPVQKTRGKSPEKISRRTENKERNQNKQHQADSAKNGEEESQEEVRKKEEMAQRKRESERQRHERKKQEKAQKKKAENPNYKPSGKRSKQRMDTMVHPATNKKKKPLISGKSYWSPSLVAYILFLTLTMMLPAYRIESASATMLGGLNIPLSTLESLSILAFNRKLKHLLPYFYKVLEKVRHMQADETVLEVFMEKQRKNVTKSYIWIYSTIASCPTQVRIYDYKPGRKGEFCKAVLASFVGVLITDAYQGYNMVEGVQHAFCFIHARRKIYDAAQNGSSRYARKLARNILMLIDKLFDIERDLQAAGYDPATLAMERQKRMSGILVVIKDSLKRIQKDQRLSSNGKLVKAANYMLNHYEELTYFLKDGNVPMHNQVSEHAARRVALYRNNSMFCGSPEGAEAFAGILTIAETARANNLDVYKYFVFLLENMRGDDFWEDKELMESLLPWSERAQRECAARTPVKEQKIRLLGGKIAV